MTMNKHPNKFKILRYSFLLCAFALCSPALFADKDVDKKRLDHQIKAQRVEQAIKREKRLQEIVNEYQETEQARNAKIKNIKARNKIKHRNCELAKARLKNLLNTNRAKMSMEDGKARYLTTDEKLQEIQKAEDAIKQYCTRS